MESKATLRVISGAGLSAESGLATFRGEDGTWSTENLDRVCNIMTWKAHREEVFEFYARRKAECLAAEPCEAHAILARWQRRWGPERVKLLTQNVDDLLERAGAAEVLHLHGSLSRLQCVACGTSHEIGAELFRPEMRCLKCGSLKGTKPGVVFFHERAPEYSALGKMRKGFPADDAVLAVGTSFEVVGPEHFMNRGRMGSPRNFLVDPKPARAEAFGRVAVQGASAGLAEIEAEIEALMEA